LKGDIPTWEFPLVQLPKKFKEKDLQQELVAGDVSISSTSEEVQSRIEKSSTAACVLFPLVQLPKKFKGSTTKSLALP